VRIATAPANGSPVFQAKVLAAGAMPLDATASPPFLADTVLAVAHAHRLN
jgi:hypothetical protein